MAETPQVGNASALQSGEASKSDPKEAAAFTQIQAETAQEASGEPPEDPRVEEYREATAAYAAALEAGPENPFFTVDYETKLGELNSRVQELRSQPMQAYNNALDEVDQTFEAVAAKTEQVKRAEAEVVPFMTPEQAGRFGEYTEAELAKAGLPFDAASEKWLKQLDDPLMQEVVAGWNPAQQREFFSDAAKYLSFSEAGRQRLAQFNDGLAGQTDDPLAEVAAELRSNSQGGDLDQLDGSLGLMVAVDGQARPEGATEREEVIRQQLGIVEGGAFDKAYNASTEAFSFANAVKGADSIFDTGENVSKKLNQPWSAPVSQWFQDVGHVPGGASALLDALTTVENIQDGDYLSAASSGAAVAKYALELVGSQVPGLAGKWITGAAGPVGMISLGITAYQFVDAQAEYPQRFLAPGLDAAMGNDPLKGALEGLDQGILIGLNLDSGQPARAQLEQRIESVLGPDWGNRDPEFIRDQFLSTYFRPTGVPGS